MPRIHRVNKARGTYKCRRCGKEITPGQPYKWFKKKGMRRSVYCSNCAIRQSDLTGGRLGEVYAVNERLMDDISTNMDRDEYIAMLEEAVGEVEGLRDEYQQSADNILEHFPNGNHVSEQCEEYVSALDDWIDSGLNAALNLARDFDEEISDEEMAEYAEQDGEDLDTFTQERALELKWENYFEEHSLDTAWEEEYNL